MSATRTLLVLLAGSQLAGCVSQVVWKAEKGDVQGLKTLLQKPVSQGDKNEALVEAVTAQKDEAASVLLDHGADPESKNEIQESALQIAIRNEDAAAVALLLDHKAEVNGAIDLWKLAKPDVAVVLLDHGADPNQKDSDGGTPLAYAACDGKADLVKLWLDRGADIKKAGRACLRGHFDIERIKPVCDDLATPLECAHAKGYGEIEKLLLRGK